MPFKSPRNKNKKAPCWVLSVSGAADGTFFSFTRLAEKFHFSRGASLENLWSKKQFPELFFMTLQVPS